MTYDLDARVDALDENLLSFIAPPITWDRRALLALHSATAAVHDSFVYLEIGSYLGGSLQALVCDDRCAQIISIDPRLELVADNRDDPSQYPDNSTAHMVALLAKIPGADTSKIWPIESTTEQIDPATLGTRPHLCFIDGEHTDEAVLTDARFCLAAMQGAGVIAFHDYQLVGAAVRTFVREHSREVGFFLTFPGRVLAVEFGGNAVLGSEAVARAGGSKWHNGVWRLTNSLHPRAALVGWRVITFLDAAIAALRSWGQKA